MHILIDWLCNLVWGEVWHIQLAIGKLDQIEISFEKSKSSFDADDLLLIGVLWTPALWNPR